MRDQMNEWMDESTNQSINPHTFPPHDLSEVTQERHERRTLSIGLWLCWPPQHTTESGTERNTATVRCLDTVVKGH